MHTRVFDRVVGCDPHTEEMPMRRREFMTLLVARRQRGRSRRARSSRRCRLSNFSIPTFANDLTQNRGLTRTRVLQKAQPGAALIVSLSAR
jgi:hypothetical protein